MEKPLAGPVAGGRIAQLIPSRKGFGWPLFSCKPPVPLQTHAMKSAVRKRSGYFPMPRWRVVAGQTVALGPGKADLLEGILDTGSIGQAAERMGMSYMRAWSLVQTMNACFNAPLVRTRRGGMEHGGATVTITGKKVLELYRFMENASIQATLPAWRKLKPLLRP